MRRPLTLVLFAIALPVALIAPFLIHTQMFIARFETSYEKWTRLDSPNYEIIVASNSLTDPTGGINTLQVQDGRIVEASNPDCAVCPLAEFAELTVDALFARVWDDCIRTYPRGFQFPICNVEYHDVLGYPARMDTYTFNDQGECEPSITVLSLRLLP